MQRISIFLFVSIAALATYACGSATPPGDTPNGNASSSQTTEGDKGDTCPVLDAGPPPECPEGCVWNGKECRKNSSIVMPDNHGDAGTKPPTK